MRLKISKCYSWPTVMILFQPNLFYIFSRDSPHKTCLYEFWNFKFQNFLKRLKFSFTWDPVGVKLSKCYSSYSFDSFSTKLFLNVPCSSPHKTCFLEFASCSLEIFYLNVLKKDWNLILCPIGKCNIANILEIASRRAKRSEIWDLGPG